MIDQKLKGRRKISDEDLLPHVRC